MNVCSIIAAYNRSQQKNNYCSYTGLNFAYSCFRVRLEFPFNEMIHIDVE